MESVSKVFALCLLKPDGGSGVQGVVKFSQEPGQKTRVVAEVTGLTPGLHGFHVHQYGNLLEGCVTAGPHFNPSGKDHGGPDSEERHHGDLGNVVAGEDGIGKYDNEDPLLMLSGEHSIIGRSVVCHADTDDLGLDGHADSKTTGHAGARLACGTIGLSGPLASMDCHL